MPTILINTNLTKSAAAAVAAVSGQENQEDVLRQDINSIISKLLSKSESMDSFMIKYDLNDLISTNKPDENDTASPSIITNNTSSCICGRLAHMFGNLLSQKSDGNQPDPCKQYQQDEENKMNSINSELKLLRKYQSELANKFNLILSKLDANSATSAPLNLNMSSNPLKSHIIQPASISNSSSLHNSNTKNINIQGLTGAKKRKFNNMIMSSNNANICSTSNNISSNNSKQIKGEFNSECEGEYQTTLVETSNKPTGVDHTNKPLSAGSVSSSSSSTSSASSHVSNSVSSSSSTTSSSVLNSRQEHANNNNNNNSNNHLNDDLLDDDYDQHHNNDQINEMDEINTGDEDEAAAGVAILATEEDEDISNNINNNNKSGEDDVEDVNEETLDEEEEEMLNGEGSGGGGVGSGMVDPDLMDDMDEADHLEATNHSDELNFYKNKLGNNNTNTNSNNTNNIKMPKNSATGNFKFNNNNHHLQSQIYQQQQHHQQLHRNAIANNRVMSRQASQISTNQHARIPSNNFNTLSQTQYGHHSHHLQPHQQTPQLNRSFNSNINNPNSFNSSQQQLQRSFQSQNNRYNFNNNNTNNINSSSQRSQFNEHQYKSIALAPLPSSSGSSSQVVKKEDPDQYEMKSVGSVGSGQSSSTGPDIDLNELFKGEGPKFLQLELYKNFKPPIFFDQMSQRSFIDDNLASSAYSKSKSRRNFAAHLAKLVFTPRERLECNCNGRFGKKALDTQRLMAIRNTLFKYYPCKQSTLYLNGDTITSGDHDENNVWIRQCLPAIDESNRVLKKQLIAWYKKNKQLDCKNGGAGTANSSFANSSMFSGGVSFNESSNNLMSSCLVDDDEQLEDDFELNI